MVGGTVLAGIVREGSEAEARRVVEKLLLLQIAIDRAFNLIVLVDKGLQDA